jgi:hypothetical protein
MLPLDELFHQRVAFSVFTVLLAMGEVEHHPVTSEEFLHLV